MNAITTQNQQIAVNLIAFSSSRTPSLEKKTHFPQNVEYTKTFRSLFHSKSTRPYGLYQYYANFSGNERKWVICSIDTDAALGLQMRLHLAPRQERQENLCVSIPCDPTRPPTGQTFADNKHRVGFEGLTLTIIARLFFQFEIWTRELYLARSIKKLMDGS